MKPLASGYTNSKWAQRDSHSGNLASEFEEFSSCCGSAMLPSHQSEETGSEITSRNTVVGIGPGHLEVEEMIVSLGGT